MFTLVFLSNPNPDIYSSISLPRWFWCSHWCFCPSCVTSLHVCRIVWLIDTCRVLLTFPRSQSHPHCQCVAAYRGSGIVRENAGITMKQWTLCSLAHLTLVLLRACMGTDTCYNNSKYNKPSSSYIPMADFLPGVWGRGVRVTCDTGGAWCTRFFVKRPLALKRLVLRLNITLSQFGTERL